MGYLFWPSSARPQAPGTSCQVQSQAQLLNEFGDSVSPNGVTPENLRNLTCSVPNLASPSSQQQNSAAILQWDASTTVSNNSYSIVESVPWASGQVSSIVYRTGVGSFNARVQINGSTLSGCGITVMSATDTTATCLGGSFVRGQKIGVVISDVAGAPNTALVQVNFSHTSQ